MKFASSINNVTNYELKRNRKGRDGGEQTPPSLPFISSFFPSRTHLPLIFPFFSLKLIHLSLVKSLWKLNSLGDT